MKKGKEIIFFVAFLLILGLNTVNAIDCDSNCLRCDTSTGICQLCNYLEGYFRYMPGGTLCMKCPDLEYTHWSYDCLSCPANCLYCKTPYQCENCKPGFYKTCDGQCKPCNIENCETCEVDTNFCSSGDKKDCDLAPQPRCTKCLNDFFLKNKGTQCVCCDSDGQWIESKQTNLNSF
jgi:proprotein convertase subtilisin/kexin type 5